MSDSIIPFTATPVKILRARDVSDRAYRLYSCLLSYRNRRTAQCNPRRATLARALHTSERSITRCLRELRVAGWVEARHVLHGTRYTVHADPHIRAKSGADIRATVGADETPVSIYEPDVLANQLTMPAAAEKGRSCKAPERPRAAAAAASGSVKENTNAPGQMALPLEAAGRSSQQAPEARALAGELLREHPEPGNLPRAIDEIGAVLALAVDLTATRDRMKRSHALWVAHWDTLDLGRFIPQLWRWVASGDWEIEPRGRKGVQRETIAERVRRESRECDERLYRRLAEEGDWEQLRRYTSTWEEWKARYEKTA